MNRRVDIGRVVALAWIVIAIGLTVLVGPHLGLRGWAWLGAHHVLCAVGAGHELWRKRHSAQTRTPS
ncbi:MAG: hypothetical protein ACOZNI_21850 [Myxococcota bacterium]